jgi:TRAP-type transport system periplasmic protein
MTNPRNWWTNLLGLCALGLVVLGAARTARAQGTELRIASRAPLDSPLMRMLGRTGEQLHKATMGRVKIKYFDMPAGDERDVLRKVKAGELHGAELSGVGLAAIDESIRVLELPMLFASPEELDYVADKVWSYFQEEFAKKGFVLLDRGEIGQIHFFSQTEVKTIEELKARKLCLAPDDRLMSALYKRLGVNSVSLAVRDVEAALSPGTIHGCYAAPAPAVAMRWTTHARSMMSMPVSFAITATVLTVDAEKQLSPADVKVMRRIAAVTAKKVRKAIRKENENARGTMTRTGFAVSPTPASTVDMVTKQAILAWGDLAGRSYSKEELKMVLDARDEYRAKRQP